MDEMFIDGLEDSADYEDREQTDFYCSSRHHEYA